MPENLDEPPMNNNHSKSTESYKNKKQRINTNDPVNTADGNTGQYGTALVVIVLIIMLCI